MKILPSSRALFVFGFLLLVTTNIVVLAGVFSNRSGVPDAVLTLTERELPLPYLHRKENSGLALRIAWRSPSKDMNYYDRGNPNWLTADKLRELGFNLEETYSSKNTGNTYRTVLPKEVYIVLEYDGVLYKRAVHQAEDNLEKQKRQYTEHSGDKKVQDALKSAKKQLEQERLSESRLFAIDAGLNPDFLRKEYTDRSRYIITKGVVRISSYYNKKQKVIGYITKLSVAALHVPLSQRKLFDLIQGHRTLQRSTIQPPRYEVKLAYGRRLEPWIIWIHPLQEKPH